MPTAWTAGWTVLHRFSGWELATVGEMLAALVDPLFSRWRNTALGLSFSCWLVVVIVFLLTHPPSAAECTRLRTAGHPWCALVGRHPIGPWVLAAAGLGVVVSSALLCTALAPAVLSVATGTAVPRRPLAQLHYRRLSRLTERLQEHSPVTVRGRQQQARIESALLRYPRPRDGGDIWPTAAANALSALRERTRIGLGLDLTVAWAPFVAALPDADSAKLIDRSLAVLRQFEPVVPVALLAVLAAWIWPHSALGAVVWTLGCLLLASALYVRSVRAIYKWIDAVEAQILLHRFQLYRSLGYIPPPDSAAEVSHGQALTTYLWSLRREQSAPAITYHWPPC